MAKFLHTADVLVSQKLSRMLRVQQLGAGYASSGGFFFTGEIELILDIVHLNIFVCVTGLVRAHTLHVFFQPFEFAHNIILTRMRFLQLRRN